MFDRYFCRKFHAKEITLDMILEKYLYNTILIWPFLGVGVCVIYDFYLRIGFINLLGVVALMTFLTYYCKIYEHITVATCPLKKGLR